MFPLGLLASLALAGFAGYQYSKAKHQNKNNTVSTNTNTNTDATKSASEKQNVYNYYTNNSENGNTLFNGQTQKKRTLFGN